MNSLTYPPPSQTRESFQETSAIRSKRSIVLLTAGGVVMMFLIVPFFATTSARARAEGPCTAPPNPALLPIPEGALVATCFSGFINRLNPQLGVDVNGFVLGVVDVRNPSANGAVQGLNWCPGMYHNENATGAAHMWTAANLGQVYGVTLDDAPNPNIYVTASTVYGKFTAGTFKPGGTGGEVYRLDGTNGDISLFGGVSLPNTGEGLGNICYHRGLSPGQFFVSNFADGRIYRLDANGAVLSTFDHATGTISNGGNPEPGDAPGFTPLGERVWGVQVYQGRLYYGLWVEDGGRISATKDNQIWSIALGAGGNFTGSPKLEITIPPLDASSAATNYSNPTSDITFSPSGTMFLAERTRLQDTGKGDGFSDAHFSRILEYRFNGTQWVPSGRNFSVGNLSNHWNAAGGVDTDCQGDIWGTGDALVTSTIQRPVALPPDPTALEVYGLQKTAAGGNTGGTTPTDINSMTYVGRTSYYVDLNGQTGVLDKTQIGSLEIYKKLCGEGQKSCAGIKAEDISCQLNAQGGLSYTFNVTNNSGSTVQSVLLTPPVGSTYSVSPQINNLSSPLQSGQSTTLTASIGNAPQGQKSCFKITLMSKEGPCCTVEICPTIPSCCARITHETVKPVPGAPGTYQYTFAITNLTNGPAEHLYLYAPPGVTITPSYFPLSPALAANGGTISQTLTASGAQPGATLCFTVSLHPPGMEGCCTIQHCIKFGDNPK